MGHSGGANEGCYVPCHRLKETLEEADGEEVAFEAMPLDSSYGAVICMWCISRSSQARKHMWLWRTSLSMYILSVLLQFALLELVSQVNRLRLEGGDPHPCMYGIGLADGLFFPTNFWSATGRGFGGYNVSVDNRETDFAVLELQEGTYDAIRSLFWALVENSALNSSHLGEVIDAMLGLDKGSDGKVFGVETHVFRFLAIFLFVAQWCRDLWTTGIHFYLLPPCSGGLGAASWVQVQDGKTSSIFAGYHQHDIFIFMVLGAVAWPCSSHGCCSPPFCLGSSRLALLLHL